MNKTLLGLENPFPYADHADPDVDPPVFVERNGEFAALRALAEDYLLLNRKGGHSVSPPIMVTGAPGAGKTYLLSALFHRTAKSRSVLSPGRDDPPTPFCLFVRRPLRSFLETYKISIIPEFKKLLTKTRPSVYNRWLLSIIERTGEKDVLTPETLLALRTNPDLISTLDKLEILRRDLLIHELEKDIKDRAPKEDVADFLMVFKQLYDQPLQDLAIKWLEGAKLTQSEMESLQVSSSLETDKRAINLLLMLSTILERAGIPFFFFLDELDLLANPQSSLDDRETFRSLLLTFLEELPRYAFVVIACLESSYQTFDSTVQTRVRHFRLSDLDRYHAILILDKYADFRVHRHLVEILSEDGVEMLVDSSGGNPRRLLSTAHIGFKRAQAAGEPQITSTHIAEAQLELNQTQSSDLKERVAKCLDELDLLFVQDVRREYKDGTLEIGFAVPDEVAPELAIYFLSAAYLQSEALKSVQALRARTKAREMWPSLRAEMLVVDGFVSREVSSQLLNYFAYTVFYEPTQFELKVLRSLRRFVASRAGSAAREISTQDRRETLSSLRHEYVRREQLEKDLETDPSLETRRVQKDEKPNNENSIARWLRRVAEEYFGVQLETTRGRQLGLAIKCLLALLGTLAAYASYTRIIQPRLELYHDANILKQLTDKESKLDLRMTGLSQPFENVLHGPPSYITELALDMQDVSHLIRFCKSTMPSSSDLPSPTDSAFFAAQVNMFKDNGRAAIDEEYQLARKVQSKGSADVQSLALALDNHDFTSFEKFRPAVEANQVQLAILIDSFEPKLDRYNQALKAAQGFFEKWNDSIFKEHLRLQKGCSNPN